MQNIKLTNHRASAQGLTTLVPPLSAVLGCTPVSLQEQVKSFFGLGLGLGLGLDQGLGHGHCLGLSLCQNLDEQQITATTILDERSGIEGDLSFFYFKISLSITCKIIIKNKSRSAQTIPGEASGMDPQAFYLFLWIPFHQPS